MRKMTIEALGMGIYSLRVPTMFCMLTINCR